MMLCAISLSGSSRVYEQVDTLSVGRSYIVSTLQTLFQFKGFIFIKINLLLTVFLRYFTFLFRIRLPVMTSGYHFY
jgi:hypothetical protein